MDAPIDWVAARTPPAPNELKAWLKIPEDGADTVPKALLKVGLIRLEEAVVRPGRDREAAYQLLAADALITYSCEAASEAGDVRGVLLEVFAGVRTGEPVE